MDRGYLLLVKQISIKSAVLVEHKHPVLILQSSLYSVLRLPYLLYAVLVIYKDGLHQAHTDIHVHNIAIRVQQSSNCSRTKQVCG